MESKLERYIQNSPRAMNVAVNKVINAFFSSLAVSDDDVTTQIENTKDQLFVVTASGSWLDRLASSVGVERPPSLGMSDASFQQLIPNLSLKPKQIRKAFYDTMDVFWGPLFSRANVTSLNFAPFNVSPGDIITITFDNSASQAIKVLAGQIATPGAATAAEIVSILGSLQRGTASIVTDEITGNEYINIRTNTPGSRGAILISSGSMVSPSKLDFDNLDHTILDLEQRTVIYEIVNRELIIEIPAGVPILRSSLKGSHHFHSDYTLAGPVAPNDGIWQGSFFYNSGAGFTVTSQNARLQAVIQKGEVYTEITVDSTAKIPNTPGFLMFDFGTGAQEEPVPYLAVTNSNTVLISAAHVFSQNHLINSYVNVISTNLHGYQPRTDGTDLAIYMQSPINDRVVVQGLLANLAAAGVIITFKILLPNYEYLIINPYSYYAQIDPSGT